MTDPDSEPSGAPRVDPRRPRPQTPPEEASASRVWGRAAQDQAGSPGREPGPSFAPARLTMRGAPVTKALILIMVAIELLFTISAELRWQAYGEFAFGVVRLRDGLYATLAWQPLTYAFLHGAVVPGSSSGLLHLGFNMAALAVVGPPVERSMGSPVYAAAYALCAIGSSLFFYGWYLAAEGFGGGLAAGATLVGASGAISGVLALEFWRRFLILGLLPEIDRPESPTRHLVRMSLLFIGVNVAIMLLPGSISGEAHIGGFLIGLLVAPIMMRRPSG